MIDYLEENTNTDANKNLQPQVAALYARVSTEKQEKEETIESQIEEVEKRIKADDNFRKIRPPKRNEFRIKSSRSLQVTRYTKKFKKDLNITKSMPENIENKAIYLQS